MSVFSFTFVSGVEINMCLKSLYVQISNVNMWIPYFSNLIFFLHALFSTLTKCYLCCHGLKSYEKFFVSGFILGKTLIYCMRAGLNYL